MAENLIFEIRNRVATITLDRPEKLNAFTDEMLDAWIHALEECRASDAVNVIVITGTGRAFTTGGDVGRFGASASNTAAAIKNRIAENIQRLPRLLDEIDKPVIAALNGFATGGGLDVALMCDMRYAAESARFAQTYARMGLIPGAGGAYYLPRLIGTARALEMSWSCEFIDAREAERIGLVNKVFPDDQLMAKTYEFAERVAKGAPLAIRLTKRILYQGLDCDLKTALNLAASNMPVVRTSEDHQEAVAAFKAKREPQFKGR
ncbi:MAG: enoyl-CoA hydratase/isomerase family protein [Betaproteobacteria bacterium]|nr:enoyl-CoA hydratase/isomerase family protein [Betaproteobacteria bacterium]MBI3052652.1 enoyl-CoA hydratase/isomerase family protein [Betaproteobacteria bacterium]